jgi:hypothetical protein
MIIGVAAALLLIEGLLRLLPIPNRFTMIQLFEGMWEPDPALLLKLKPNLDIDIYGHPEFRFLVQTNQAGLRDGPITPPVEIAAIGDSFTFGFGVDARESWPEQLGQISGLEVANLGWAGWSSYVYPVTIRRFAIPLEAEIWIWGFYGNDLPESADAELFLNSGEGDYLSWNQVGHYRAQDLPFPWNLRTLQFVAALSDPQLFLLPDSGEQLYEGPEFTMRFGKYPWETTDPNKPEIQRGWELSEAAFLEAKALAEEHGAHLLVFYIPAREHVYWPYIEALVTEFDIRQLDDVEARLADFFERHDIHYLNLLSGFRERALTGEMLDFPQDGHWNALGHDYAAQLIYSYLLDNELVTIIE